MERTRPWWLPGAGNQRQREGRREDVLPPEGSDPVAAPVDHARLAKRARQDSPASVVFHRPWTSTAMSPL